MELRSREEEVKSGLSPWFALRVRSNRELVAARHLRDRGFEEYCPSYKVTSQWSDRKRVLDKFLFPGYVFCRLDISNRFPVLSVPGVVGLVGYGKTPAPIPEYEMGRVRAMADSGLAVIPWPYLASGDMVLIERGPLAGVEGILQNIKGKYRLVVSFSLLQRSVSAEIDRAWVRPIKASSSAANPPRSSGNAV
jgi:transcription antitermination factor NusG